MSFSGSEGVTFEARVCRSKCSLYFVAPTAFAPAVRAMEFFEVRVRHGARAFSFLANARPTHHVSFTLPSALVGSLETGRTVAVQIVPLRERPLRGAFVEEGVAHYGRAPTKTPLLVLGDYAVPVSPYLSTSFRAAVALTDDVAWLLGFYQAEGNKTVNVFSLTQKSPWLLKRAARILQSSFGFRTQDLFLDIIHGSTSADHARRMYREVGVPIDQVRPSTARTREQYKLTHTANLCVRSSGPFGEAFQWGLEQVLEDVGSLGVLQGHYLKGFLDGDGTLTYQKSTTLRACASLGAEQLAVRQAAAYVFGGKDTITSPPSGGQPISRNLSLHDMLWLIESGTFAASSSRPRLFHAIYASLQHIARGTNGARQVSAGDLDDIKARLTKHDDEWRYIRTLYPTLAATKLSRKGVLYAYPGTVW